MKKDTFIPQLMSAEEATSWLDSKGFSYKLCDVPIPIMTGRVNCGAPVVWRVSVYCQTDAGAAQAAR